MIFSDLRRPGQPRGKQKELPKSPRSPLFYFLLILFLEEFIASPAPASSEDFFGLLLLESALTFHFSISGFTHTFACFFFIVIDIPPHSFVIINHFQKTATWSLRQKKSPNPSKSPYFSIISLSSLMHYFLVLVPNRWVQTNTCSSMAKRFSSCSDAG